MKKFVLLLLPFVLASCGKSSTNTTSEVVTEEMLFERFVDKLSSLEGTIKQENITTDRTMSYITTGSDFFDMKTKTIEEKEKFKKDGSFLVDSIGVESYLNDDGTISSQSDFHSQLYNNETTLYKITNYTDPGFDNIHKEYALVGSDIESFYALGFVVETKTNLNMINRIKSDKDHYEYSYTNFEGNIENNELKFTYQLDNYEIEKGKRYLTESVSYDYTLSIEHGLCKNYILEYKYNVYVGGVLMQKMDANVSSSIIQGNLSEYNGEIIS